jgi:2-phosphosulfolactate phosphatase
VRFERGERGLSAIAADAAVVVIIDVLSFSTAVDVAIAAGAFVKATRPRMFADEATLPNTTVLAVSRRDRSDANPYSLSPDTLSALPPGARLILRSPNGATLVTRAQELRIPIIIAACLRNAPSVAAFVRQRSRGGIIAVVSACERWPDGSLRPALEDDFGAGAGAVLDGIDLDDAAPEARTIAEMFTHAKQRLAPAIQTCVSGRELIESGYAADVERACEFDRSRCVPTLAADGFFTNAR